MFCIGLVGLRCITLNLPTFVKGVFKTRPKLSFRSHIAVGAQLPLVRCSSRSGDLNTKTEALLSWPKRLSTLVRTMCKEPRNRGEEEAAMRDSIARAWRSARSSHGRAPHLAPVRGRGRAPPWRSRVHQRTWTTLGRAPTICMYVPFRLLRGKEWEEAAVGLAFDSPRHAPGGASISPKGHSTHSGLLEEASTLAAPAPAEVHFLGNVSFTDARWKGWQVVHPFLFHACRLSPSPVPSARWGEAQFGGKP